MRNLSGGIKKLKYLTYCKTCKVTEENHKCPLFVKNGKKTLKATPYCLDILNKSLKNEK